VQNRKVKVAEFEHFPVVFLDNRELWEKVFSGQDRGWENTRKEVGRKVLLAISKVAPLGIGT
jgi:hypothetical protein